MRQAFAGEVFVHHQIDGRQRRRAANRIAGVRGRHAADGLRIHNLRACRPPPPAAANLRCLCRTWRGPARCRNARSPTWCRFARSRPALHPESAALCGAYTIGAAPACIPAARTPRCRPGRFPESRRRHSADRRFCSRKARSKAVERRVGSAEAIRKRNLHETRIQIADPFLQPGMPPACCDPSVRP